jgi:hypothetical protein
MSKIMEFTRSCWKESMLVVTTNTQFRLKPPSISIRRASNNCLPLTIPPCHSLTLLLQIIRPIMPIKPVAKPPMVNIPTRRKSPLGGRTAEESLLLVTLDNAEDTRPPIPPSLVVVVVPLFEVTPEDAVTDAVPTERLRVTPAGPVGTGWPT